MDPCRFPDAVTAWRGRAMPTAERQAMCHHCVIENVKSNMLSRRGFFTGGIAAGAAAVAVAATPAPLFAQGAPTKAADLTHELFETFPTYFGAQQLFIEQKFNHKEHTFNLNEWRLSEHTGTHID